MIKRIFAVMALLALAGCATRSADTDFSAFRAAAPRSILVVPVVNKSLDVDAPSYLLSSLAVPLAERGYYVFPVNTTKVVLEQEGFYEGEQIHGQPPQALAKLFDADAVLYVTINRWDAQYMVFSTQVTVAFEYRMIAKDGTEIWTTTQELQYSPQQNSGGGIAGLVASAIAAAVERASPNYMPLAQQANRLVFLYGPNAPPPGPYLKAQSR